MLPISMESLGKNAFAGCTGMKRMRLPDCCVEQDVKTTNGNNYSYSSSYTNYQDAARLEYLSVPDSSIVMVNKVDDPSSVRYPEVDTLEIRYVKGVISKNLFNPQKLILTSGFRNISCMGFWYIPDMKGLTSRLTEVLLPDTLEVIGDRTFYNCSGLTSLHIPESVKEIGEYAFSGCSGLTELQLPDSLEKLGEGAFNNCTSLKSMVFPAAFTCTDNEDLKSMFEGCSSLQKVTLPENMCSSISESMFMNCVSLESIILPDSVKEIQRLIFAAV